MSETGLPTEYQSFIHTSRYARYNDEQGRRETWEETVERYLSFFEQHLTDNHSKALSKWKTHKAKLRRAIINLEIMPSMRAMMTAGDALSRDNVAGFNCSYVAVDHPRAFDEAMYILMCGTGVGFSVERQFVNKLPEVSEDMYATDTTIKVPDSKIGWAKSFKELISMLYGGTIPKWDLSELRPAGARLKTFGGRSSGPGPLDELFRFAVDTFVSAKGRKLTSLECHDLMCKIGDIVVVGGVRRSALISLSNLSDDRMRNAKNGKWWESNGQRALANNSAVYTERPDMETFMREWLSLIESKSGERGIFNRNAAQKAAARSERRDVEQDFGTNPCSEIILRSKQFCVAGDTPLITDNGIHHIESLQDREANIWNGEEWTPVTIRKTGSDQQLMRVTLSDGSYLDCTPDHRWSVKTRFQKDWSEVQTKDLMSFSKYPIQVEPAQVQAPDGGIDIEEPYTLGFAVGDGCSYRGKVLIDLYGDKDMVCPVKGNRHIKTQKVGYSVQSQRVNATDVVSHEQVSRMKSDLSEMGDWSKDSVLNFLAGLADADGSNTGTGGIRVYLSQEHRARTLQLVLSKNGIISSCNLASKKRTKTNLGVRKDDLWYIQITDCGSIPCHRLDTSGGHKPKFKGKFQNIKTVEKLIGLHDTFCFNEPKKHKGMFANVLTHQCNLSEVVVRREDTMETLLEKVELATILGTLQATLTNFKYLRGTWATNTAEESLLGVSLTGIMDNPLTTGEDIDQGVGGHEMLGVNLDNLRERAIDANRRWAKSLGINQSTAITCVKPSGTVSQLVNSASGIHPRYSHYYVRTVRSDKKDPLAQFMVDKGFPVEDDVTKPQHNYVFSFPVEAPHHSVMRDDMSAIQQLKLWKVYAEHWCEHKPSITVYVREDEWLSVGAWVYENFDHMSGVSFLPHTEHVYRQAPYQEISKEEYEEMAAAMPKDVDWTQLKEYEEGDNTTGTQELACTGGVCELVDMSVAATS